MSSSSNSDVADDTGSPGDLYCSTCEKVFTTGTRCPNDGARLMKLKARTDPFVGRELEGRYTVLEKLGQGGMGAVYRARQHSVDREVAIKVVNSNLITDDEVIKRFLREAKLASKLAHPNAVAVLDFGQTDDGVFYLVMELVGGRTLAQELKAAGRFRPERVVRIGMQVLDALEGAHALSIIHRDLKPSNIMLLSHGRDLVKVLDFGLAKSILPDQTATTMTGTGAVLGTPAFMPPELATGSPCDGRADLYSLGVILYLLGSGRLPFVSESVHELIAMHASDDPAPPITGVPHRLGRVIHTLLEKDPAKRYQTAAEALHALESSHATITPVAGVPVDSNPATNPSLQRAEDIGLLDTPVPPSLAARKSEVEELARSETMLPNQAAAPAIAVSTAGAKRPGRRARIAVAAIAVLGAALVTAFVVGRPDRSTPEASSTNRAPVVDQPIAAPAPSPTVAAPTTPSPTAPIPTPRNEVTTGPGSATAAKPEIEVSTGSGSAAATKQTNDGAKDSRSVTIAKPTKKSDKPTKPTVKRTTPGKPATEKPTTTAKPPTSAGSAASPGQMPF